MHKIVAFVRTLPSAPPSSSRWQRLRTAVTSLVLGGALALNGSPDASAQQQSPQWLFSGSLVDFRDVKLATPTQQAVPVVEMGAPSFLPKYPANPTLRSFSVNNFWNAQYDYKGNLLFYINGTRVYNFDDIEVVHGGTTAVDGTIGHNHGHRHITIVPRPGSCDEYYLVAFDYPGPTNAPILYWWVLNTTNWTITGGPYDTNGTTSYEVKNSAGVPVTTVRVQNSVIAVGPPLFEDSSRWLYAFVNAQDQVIKIRVTSSGLTSYDELLPRTLGNNNYAGPDGVCTAAKVSNDGTRLVYTLADLSGNNGHVVSVALGSFSSSNPGDLAGYGTLAPAQVVRSEPLAGRGFGVEFGGRDANFNDRLLVSSGEDGNANSGIRFAHVSTSSIALSPFGPSTASYAQSQIERGLDGRLYAVSETNLLRRVNIPSTTTSVPTLGVSIGTVIPTLVPWSHIDAAPFQRTWANQWQPTGGPDSNPAGYIHTQLSATRVNVNGGDQTVTYTLASGFSPANWWVNWGTATPGTITWSGNVATITIPQNAVPVGGTANLYAYVSVNTPCGPRIAREKRIVVENVVPCTGCRPGPLQPSGHLSGELTAYPNPVSNHLIVKDATGAADATLTHVLTGRQTRVVLTANQTSIPVASLPEGIYWLEVKTGEGVRRERIVVRH